MTSNGKADNMLDLARRVLDRQLIDADEVPCGKVDDLELVDLHSASPRATAILVGRQVATERLPALLRWICRKLPTRRPVVRVSWEQVREVKDQIKLKCTAAELGLGERDTRSYAIVSRLPWSWKPSRKG